MVKILYERNGKKYEFTTHTCLCKKCAFYNIDKTLLRKCAPKVNGYDVCGKLAGIWKEVRDAD